MVELFPLYPKVMEVLALVAVLQDMEQWVPLFARMDRVAPSASCPSNPVAEDLDLGNWDPRPSVRAVALLRTLRNCSFRPVRCIPYRLDCPSPSFC